VATVPARPSSPVFSFHCSPLARCRLHTRARSRPPLVCSTAAPRSSLARKGPTRLPWPLPLSPPLPHAPLASSPPWPSLPPQRSSRHGRGHRPPRATRTCPEAPPCSSSSSPPLTRGRRAPATPPSAVPPRRNHLGRRRDSPPPGPPRARCHSLRLPCELRYLLPLSPRSSPRRSTTPPSRLSSPPLLTYRRGHRERRPQPSPASCSWASQGPNMPNPIACRAVYRRARARPSGTVRHRACQHRSGASPARPTPPMDVAQLPRPDAPNPAANRAPWRFSGRFRRAPPRRMVAGDTAPAPLTWRPCGCPGAPPPLTDWWPRGPTR
jgi:hypothetical protein